MRKKIVMLVLLLFLLPNGLYSEAATSKQRIFDDANILSSSEKEHLEGFAKKYSDKRKVDFIVITMHGDEDITTYMGDFYDEQGLGYDQARGDVALIALNMKTRDVQLAGFGHVEDTLPDERFYTIREKVTAHLSSGHYEKAFEDFIRLSARYMQFKEGVDPANPFYNPYVQFAVALIIGIGIVLGLSLNRKTRITATAATYYDAKQSKVNRKEDQYLRKTVTKKYSPKEKNSGGGGGGGGFSGGGTTRGGSSFSGSRGKF